MNRIRRSDIEWVYINLANRQDRDAETRKQCERVGISAERFEAHTSSEWNGGSELFTHHSKPGQIGCSLSHLALIEDAKHRNGIVGILEDDVMLCEDFSERMQYVEDVFDKPWDIFFLHASFHLRPVWHRDTLGKDFELTDTKHIARVYGLWCTQSYLVNCESAEKIQRVLIRNIHHAHAIDHAYILSQPDLNCFCFVPGMTAQFDNWSDITCTESTYSGFFPLGPHVYCEHLDEFDYDNFLDLVKNEYSPNAND